MIYLLTVILAYCSVVYELLLGQMLSAFLGNTVLRYSITIGLYLFSMGIGSYLLTEKRKQRPLSTLLKVELFLALIGGSGIAMLFLLDSLGPPMLVFSLFAHSLIIIIGILTGIEIPLLIELRHLEKPNRAATVLGVDYIGAFAGTLCFAFIFYPKLGLVFTTFFVAAMNALAGILLITKASLGKKEPAPVSSYLYVSHGILFSLLLVCMWHSSAISNYFIAIYTGTA